MTNRPPTARPRTTRACLLIALTLAATVARAAQPPPAPAIAKLADTPPNTWLKLAEEPSGGRAWPALYFDPTLKQFLVTAGGYEGPPHADTEIFDPATNAWANAHPAAAPYKSPAGPTDAPKLDFRDTDVLKPDANGAPRIFRGLNPYLREPGLYHQFAYHDAEKKLYAYYHDHTLTLDPATRTWTDLKAARFSKSTEFSLVYGALAYDPVNQETISFGGTSDEDGGSPGTWAFDGAANAWKRIPAASPDLLPWARRARDLHRAAAAMTNAARNRFYRTETAAEAAADLSLLASRLAAKATAFSDEPAPATPSAARVAARGAALARAIAIDLGDLAKSLADAAAVTPDLLADAQRVVNAAQRLERDVAAEPSGRAAAQLAVDRAAGKIILFGGCTLSGYLADTWVYDCKSRQWAQRFPVVSPAPRAGHALAWLPKSGKIVLYGATPFTNPYNVPGQNPRPPQDLWTYDLPTDTWKLLAGPAATAPTDGVGAVDDNDTLLFVARDAKNKARRVTWAMRVDPAAPDAGSTKAGVASGGFTTSFGTPADFDKVTRPDPAAIAKLIDQAPANQWTGLPAPPRKPNPHPWGTSPYDTARQQLLEWGGGHSQWHLNDVAHFSLRTATWSTGYPDEFPYANAIFKGMFNQTFTNRPVVPTHVWDAAAYDPISDRMVVCVRGTTWTYDPATRDWDYPPGPKMQGDLYASMKGTPRGVVHWDKDGNLRLWDGKARAWNPLPVTRGKLGGAYGDTTGICYDPKRDCLWLSNDGGPMHRYDFATGALTTLPVPRPAGLVMREVAYVPELDMILSAGRIPGPDNQPANLAYDIPNNRWLGVELPCTDNQPRTTNKDYASISLAIHYDPKLKRAISLSNNQSEVLIARFDRATLKTFDPKLKEDKKR